MSDLIIHPFSGISGDMTACALASLHGNPQEALNFLKSAGLSDKVEVEFIKKKEGEVEGFSLNISPLPTGKIKKLKASESLLKLIKSLKVQPEIKIKALSILKTLSDAEGKVHGVPPEKVQFHEIGGWDTLVDILLISYFLYALNLEKIYTFPINLGGGCVKIHGRNFPVPPPAVEILLEGFPVFIDGTFEKTTPTGAAFLKTYAEPAPSGLRFRILKTGYGFGKRREKGALNALRIWLCETQTFNKKNLLQLECQVDDMSGEEMEGLIELLLSKGAVDAYFAPLHMKKGRPGFLITCLTEESHLDDVAETILKFTSTAGVRFWNVIRRELTRETITIETRWGKVRFKKITKPDGVVDVKPEMRDVQRIARRENISPRNVRQILIEALKNSSDKNF